MAASFFISFAQGDRKVANTLCAALESRGFECWISSRDIKPGENFQIAIVRAIRKVKIMLLVFTSSSNNSEEMSKELALASQQKLMVIPLRVEDVAPNDAFSYEFATRQWIDFFADWEFAITQLATQIGNALGGEPAPVRLEEGAPPPDRALPVAAQVEAGNVMVCDGPWHRSFLEELTEFPQGAKDDQVDALSRAFSTLLEMKTSTRRAFIPFNIR